MLKSLCLGGIFIFVIRELVRCISLLICFLDEKLLGLFGLGGLLCKFGQVLLAGVHGWVILSSKDNCGLHRFSWLILFFLFKPILTILLIAIFIEHVIILNGRNLISCECCIFPLEGPFVSLLDLSSSITTHSSVLLLFHLLHVFTWETGTGSLFGQITLEGHCLLLRLYRPRNSIIISRGFLERFWLVLIDTFWIIFGVQNLFWNDNLFGRRILVVWLNFLVRLRRWTCCSHIIIKFPWGPFLGAP